MLSRLSWVAFVLLTAQVHAQTFDILGVKLGMTEAEALAALKAQEPALKISRVESVFSYTDGVKQFETAPFLSEINASRPGSTSSNPNFRLLFTPPPQGGKLWAFERLEPIKENKPSQDQYVAALVQKYGKPTAVSREGAALSWDFPAGRSSCLRIPHDPGYPQWRPSSPTGDLDLMLTGALRAKRAPADLGQCASQLYYVLSTTGGHVIDNFRAILLDVPLYVSSAQAANAEVDALEKKAQAARASQGKAPAL